MLVHEASGDDRRDPPHYTLSAPFHSTTMYHAPIAADAYRRIIAFVREHLDAAKTIE